MATVQLLRPPWSLVKTPRTELLQQFDKASIFTQFPTLNLKLKLHPVKVTVKGDDDDNVATESQNSNRRGRKKSISSSPSSSTTPTRKSKHPRKTQMEISAVEAEYRKETKKETDITIENAAQLEKDTVEAKPRKATMKDTEVTVENAADYDDDIDFPYENPPLLCCFGAVQKDFLPTVRVFDEPMDPDIYSEWKMLQWVPPEFVRAPGGPPSNVAVSHVRLGGRAALMGKVGKDELGDELVLMLNKEKVQTRAMKSDSNAKTACTYMRVNFEDGKMKMETVRESAEDSLLSSELNISILKEAKIFHFNSEVLTSPTMASSLFRAIDLSKAFGGLTFFDPNLPLTLWKSRDETWKIIKKAWDEANIIEVSREELEFLLDEDYYVWRKNYRHQYYAESYEKSKTNRRDYYHYKPEEISPLWHDGLKFLFVTDGTLRIHYYTPSFHGEVIGTEDVLVAPYTCDRTGSGDAMVAAIIRKLTTCPEMSENQDVMERQLRFVIAAGIISQWTTGAVRGYPTENATQNLKEQVYVPSLW